VACWVDPEAVKEYDLNAGTSYVFLVKTATGFPTPSVPF